MRNLAKYSLAVEIAVAGVAMAQMQNDPAVPGNPGAAVPAATDVRAGQTDDMHQDHKMPAGTVRASKLIGITVSNQQDKHLGEIKDIVLDKDNKRVGYVVLSYGGIAGMGGKLCALPRSMVQFAATGKDRAVVSLDEQALKDAPAFDQNKWPAEANADYYQKLDQYYQQHGGNVTGQPAAARIGDEGAVVWNHRASSLVGASVKSPLNEKLGEINDLVLDWSGGQVRYAVLSYGGILGIGDKLFAVPIQQFQTRGDELVLGMDKEQLKNAPGFDKNQWPDMADTQWSKPVDEFYQQHGMTGQGNTAPNDMAH